MGNVLFGLVDMNLITTKIGSCLWLPLEAHDQLIKGTQVDLRSQATFLAVGLWIGDHP